MCFLANFFACFLLDLATRNIDIYFGTLAGNLLAKQGLWFFYPTIWYTLFVRPEGDSGSLSSE